MNNDIPPAIACTLKGGYLIEASAGTGKTWTLTGIILRLLIEEKYAPEKIIATTFTRAAAIEIQERIQERLSVFYRYLLWLKSKQDTNPSWFDDTCHIKDIIKAAQTQDIESADDPINTHLIAFLFEQNISAFDDAIRRVKLLFATLDKLFVGTLDSLAQKWLKEFSAEIGYESKAQILKGGNDIVRTIIHDSLRQEQACIVMDHPKLYQLLCHSNILSDVKGVYAVINLGMQFFDAPIDDIKTIDYNTVLGECEQRLANILSINTDCIACFFDKDYRDKVGIRSNLTLPQNLHCFEEIKQLITTYSIGFVLNLTDRKSVV